MTAMQSVPLSMVAKIDRTSLAPEKIQGDTAYLGLEHIESGGRILDIQKVESGELRSSKFRFTPKHILYGKLRPYLAKIALPDFYGICSTDIIPILPGPDIDRKYLLYFLRQRSMVEYANSRSSGANLPRLSPKELANFQVPLPPLREQKRIAKILDSVDALRAKRRESLAQLDVLLQSTFLDLFGDPVTNPKGWPVVEAQDVFKSSPRIGTTTPASGNGYIVVRVGELGSDRIDFERCGRVPLTEKDKEKFRLEPGDTVLARAIGSRNHLGKCSYFDGYEENVYIDSHVMRLRPNHEICNPIWFYSLMKSEQGKRLIRKAGGQTAVQFNINAKQASSIKLPLPDKSLQDKYTKIYVAARKSWRALRLHGKELDLLFQSLQQRAFSGEL